MKPTFALDLSREAAALLHRTSKGWLSLGEVAFDAPDLDDQLAYLRKTALGLSPLDMACKIILPESQILYTEVQAPGPSREDKRRQIAAALEGRTPYAVEDLVFDWSGKGAVVKVAVVARETLAEAEAFAVAHRLNPVSIVAIPPEGAFVGEAWFGPTAAAEPLIAAGGSVDRDREAVVILARDPAPAPEVAPKEAPAPTPLAAAAPVVPPDPADDDEALPGLAEALEGLPVAPPPPAEATPDAPPAAADEVAPAAAPDPAPAPAAEPAEDSFAKVLAEVEAEPEAEIGAKGEDEAPFTHVADAAGPGDGADPQAQPVVPPPASVLADGIVEDVPPAPPAAAMMAFASRRAGAPPPPPARPLDAPTRPGPAASGKGFAGLVTAPTIPGTKAKPKLKPAVPAAAPARVAASSGAVRSPARPGGTFGTSAPPRARTGVVFVVLVALLLVSLAAIAAWSSFWLSRNDSETSAAVSQEVLPESGVEPGVEDEMLADLHEPAPDLVDPLPEAAGVAAVEGGAAALATEDLADAVTGAGTDPAAINLAAEEATDLPAGTLADAAAGLADAAVPEPAPATTVVTDLTAATAPPDEQDEIFLSAMDAPPPALDALALPAPAATVDRAPAAPMPPPAFGTVYQFDARGLLVPTPEGILSPDGVMLIAGPPPRLPPARSAEATEAARAAALAAAEAVAAPASPDAALAAAGASLVAAPPAAEVPPAPADPALAGVRPLPRPAGLAPPAAADDGASLAPAPAVDTRLAGLRPLPRPASMQSASVASGAPDLGVQGASLAAQAEAQSAAANAAAAALVAENPSVILFSMRPAARPADLQPAIEAAVAAAVREPEPEIEVAATPALKPEELEEVDEPEAVAAAPQIPTRASVAKQATYTNAINLSRLNLIGTFGTESRRTALVRQANGRYKEVGVGDRIDGGTIQAITETEVRYQKNGRIVALTMPKG
jgi:hypothetical protein